MIVETICDLFLDMMTAAMQGMEIISLPTQFIKTLATILSYGVWVVGLDVMSIIFATITGWWLIKFTVGLVVWIIGKTAP